MCTIDVNFGGSGGGSSFMGANCMGLYREVGILVLPSVAANDIFIS